MRSIARSRAVAPAELMPSMRLFEEDKVFRQDRCAEWEMQGRTLVRKGGDEMAKAKKTYRIEPKAGWMSYLLRELDKWGESRFTIETEAGCPVILTTYKNVVDVATESFIKMPDNVTITEVKG